MQLVLLAGFSIGVFYLCEACLSAKKSVWACLELEITTVSSETPATLGQDKKRDWSLLGQTSCMCDILDILFTSISTCTCTCKLVNPVDGSKGNIIE